jgi:hypothetical protein
MDRMSPPGGKDLTLKIFGLDAMAGEVFADVFAKKVTDIIRGLKKVDKLYNGGARHDYVVVGLKIGSAEIDFREKVISEKQIKKSPSTEFLAFGISASRSQSLVPSDDAQSEMLTMLKTLCKNASNRFDYATLRNGEEDIIRVDKFLERQVDRIIRAELDTAASEPVKYFVGEATGTFDGVIEAIDLKGEAPDARLILSAGGKPIDCILMGLDLDEVRRALGSRIAATGRAIYEGKTGLPSRLEIRSIKQYGDRDDDILSLFGSFKPAPLTFWDDAN